jgi:hypothetical protein
MTKFLILCFIFFCSRIVFAQEETRFESEKWVLDYLLNYVLEEPADTQYIEIRNQNLKLESKICTNDKIVLSDTLKSGNRYYIEISSRPFEPHNHQITFDSSTVIHEYSPQKSKRFAIGKIDGYEAYGIDGDIPNSEIGVFHVKINDISLDIPSRAFTGLYEPNFCSYIEAYESIDSKKLYIYMSGSDAGGGYMVKWIFDHSSYITRFTTIYESGGFEFLDGQILLE